MPAAPCFTPVFIIACLYCNWVGSYEFLHELCAEGCERPPSRRFLLLSLICSWLLPSQEDTTNTFTCKWVKSDDMNRWHSATAKRKKKTNRLCETKALKRRCTHAAPRRGTRQDRPTLQSDIWASFLCWGLLTPHSFTSLTLNAARYKTTDRIQ